MEVLSFLIAGVALVAAIVAFKQAGELKAILKLYEGRILELERRLQEPGTNLPPETPEASPKTSPLSRQAPQPTRAGVVCPPDVEISRPSVILHAEPSSPTAETSPSVTPAEIPARRPAGTAPAPSARPSATKQGFDWEGLVGVKLFSWVAGVALLLSAIFFLRYSIDQGWLTPLIRMAIGTLVGILLLVLCELKAARRYPVTANAMDASGVAILFASFFASYALWNLIGATAAFVLLALVTAAAVLLSIRRDSLFIAVLGLLGGFASPALLSTGENRPLTLFGYLLLLNVGLAWVAARRKWPLLTMLSVVLTALYQWGWVVKFLTADQLPLASGIFLIFPILTFTALGLGGPGGERGREVSLRGMTAELSALLPLLFAVYTASVSGYGSRFGILFAFLFLLDAGLFAIAIARRRDILHAAGGISTLIVFAAWFLNSYDGGARSSIPLAIGLFGLFYLGAPLAARRFGRPLTGSGALAVYAAPLLLPCLAVVAVPVRAEMVPLGLLMAVLLVLDLAVGAAAFYLRHYRLPIVAAAASALDLMVWTTRAPNHPWPAVIILAAAGLVVLSLGLMRVWERSDGATGSFRLTPAIMTLLAQVVAIAAAFSRYSPGIGFLLAAHLFFLAVLLYLARMPQERWLAVAGVLPATVAVFLWMAFHSGPEFLPSQFLFAVAIYATFIAYPLLLGRRAGGSSAPHLAAVLASVAFFFQTRYVMEKAGFGYMIGLLPVFQAGMVAILLKKLLAMEPAEERNLKRLSLVAGTALAFVTVAIPLQLEKYWITVGWALEGAALAWLYRRIPYRGIFYWSSALLAAVFVRLAMNPEVLVYAPRGNVRIWNWFLYAYLLTAAAMILAGRLLAKTRDVIVEGLPGISSLLPAGGTVLLFLLLNIEIADFYSMGTTIDFNFTATLAQDLTYTLGWALFAVTLLAIGIAVRNQPARIAALGLLVVTVLKCFLHDLARLGGLYRVISFMGLALCLMLVAIVLQKFVLSARGGARQQ